MPAGDLRSLLAASFWDRNDQWISAAIAIALALAVAFLVDRAFARRWSGSISRRTDTRLRFVRRVIYASILLIGIALALSQFTGVNKLAASVLASGAIVAAVIGFAAQRTLGNFVAGVMLAVTQPLRIGDWVTFEDIHGVVEDVRLNFTVLRLPSETRVIVPNERLASGVLRNDTLVVDAVGLDVTLWLPPGADTDRAIAGLQEETGGTATVAEVAAEGIRLAVSGERVAPGERGTREADLRARCLRRLREDGLIG
jgi:small-conductance mechanosensitive channel